jgi:hypothetical protein
VLNFCFSFGAVNSYIIMSMPCCPPDSEKYLAPDYNTVGTIATLPDGTDAYYTGSGPNAVIVVPDVFGWNGGRCVVKEVYHFMTSRGDLIEFTQNEKHCGSICAGRISGCCAQAAGTWSRRRHRRRRYLY